MEGIEKEVKLNLETKVFVTLISDWREIKKIAKEGSILNERIISFDITTPFGVYSYTPEEIKKLRV